MTLHPTVNACSSLSHPYTPYMGIYVSLAFIPQVNKISPHKSKKGKSRKTSSKGSTPTCTASTQKDNEQLSSSSYSRKKSWVREEGTEEDDPPIGEESRVPERRALQEEITRRLEEEIARRQEEEIARGQEEIARRQMEDEARKQKELDEQRRLERWVC